MSDQQPKQFTLTVRTVPAGAFWAPPERRLARLLKALLRGYGFRCVSVKELADPPNPTRTLGCQKADPSRGPEREFQVAVSVGCPALSMGP